MNFSLIINTLINKVDSFLQPFKETALFVLFQQLIKYLNKQIRFYLNRFFDSIASFVAPVKFKLIKILYRRQKTNTTYNSNRI